MKEIRVGLGTCGYSAGGEAVYRALEKEIKEKNLDVKLKETGCMGMCYEEVLVEVLGKEFDGVLGCDYFSAYRKYIPFSAHLGTNISAFSGGR